MKAITIMQPWATLIAIKAKHYETRGWTTYYRGPLAIHASATFTESQRRLARSGPFSEVLFGSEYDLPLGSIVAVCQLTAVFKTSNPAGQSTFEFAQDNRISVREEAFGDFSPGRFAWLLTNVIALENPIPAKGALGLWEWNDEALILDPAIQKYENNKAV